jgi:hypothetical protein
MRPVVDTVSAGLEQCMSVSHRRTVWSRRKILSAAAGGSAAAALGAFGVARASTTSSAVPNASAAGDVVGKITVGYQGWFAAKGDSAPINGWWHWAQNCRSRPRRATTP